MAKVQPGAWVYDKDLECMVPKYGRNYHGVSEKRSDLACPYMQPGGMPEIMSHTNGKYYDTRRNYYKEVRRADCEIVGMTRADREWHASLAGTLSSRNSSISTPRSTSLHSSGVETVACGVGRTE